MSRHILIVDDEIVWLKNLEFMLTHRKYQVTSTTQGQDALDFIIHSPENFGAILLDLMMPDMDGLEVLSLLQPLIKVQKLPIIMQTGTQEDHYIHEAFSLGAICCLRKPYGPHELYPILDRIVNGEVIEKKVIYS